MRSGITRRWLRGSLLITVLLVLLAETMFLYNYTRSYYNSVQQTMYRRFSSVSGQLKMYTGDTVQSTAATRSVALRRMVEQFADKDKYEFMLLDSYGGVIASSSGTNADGIVTGVLTPEGELDVDALRPIYASARAAAKAAGRPVICTLHRAFDVCKDPFAALEAAKALNLGTILTSGQAASAPAGASLLRRLVEAAGPDLEILVGAGVTPANLPALAAETGAHAFHMSGKQVLDSRMTFRREGVPMGLPGFSEFELWQTSEETIRKARNVLDTL